MAEVIIYGANDDLIEIEGAIHDEFTTDTSGDDILVVGGSGQLVRVSVFMHNGDWTALAKIVNNPVMSLSGPSIRFTYHARPDHIGDDRAVTVRFEDEDVIHVFKLDRYS